MSPVPSLSRGGRASLPREGDVVLGKLRVERVIGEGGMAIVYAARHELLDLPVALKVLNPRHATDETIRRFFHEAQISARIRSDHVCTVLDVGLVDDRMPYMVMERLEGVTLEELLAARGSLAVGEVVDLALQALEGLTHAHAVGVVHRDVKPRNLFLSMSPRRPPVLKLIDFGISKSQMLEGLTHVGSFIGSPTYVAPEQITEPASVDARTDLWALGVVIYELLAGRMPFDGTEINVLLSKILHDAPPPIGRADVPRELEAVIRRCLGKTREERYGSTFELAAALAPFGTCHTPERLHKIAAAATRDETSLLPVSGAVPIASPLPSPSAPPSTPGDEPRASGTRLLRITTRLDRAPSSSRPPPAPAPPSPPIAASPRYAALLAQITEQRVAIALAIFAVILSALVAGFHLGRHMS